jgi:hypothetical protein
MGTELMSCLSCGNLRLCYFYHRIVEAMDGVVMLNLYQDNRTPGIFTDLYEAIGNACLEYKEK